MAYLKLLQSVIQIAVMSNDDQIWDDFELYYYFFQFLRRKWQKNSMKIGECKLIFLKKNEKYLIKPLKM